MRNSVHLDPRTKLLSIAAMAVAVALAPSTSCEVALMCVASAFGVVVGVRRGSAVALVLGISAVVAARFVPDLDGVALRTALTAFLVLVRKMFACGLIAYATVRTTPVSEFMGALVKARAPRSLVVPLAVALRYLPVVREDWRAITTAMRMRGVSPSPAGFLRAPMRTIDCVYAPLLLGAGRVADELAVASIARGIENPVRRTCYLPIAMGGADYAVLAVFGATAVGSLALRALA
ncbi:hypothetical protein HMPREF9005_1959 [Actinomyces sp. oral taxon 178 str. F0338]|nr:hypothetical protein HMPREF9005_1959 [Actinomyces sp. oral taxon 178 str. F0338]